VITATVIGLIAVLEFHTRPSAIAVTTIPAAGTAVTSPTAAASPKGKPTAGSGAAPKASSPSTQSSSKTVDGPQINYNWGVMSVSVTAAGNKITKVGIASLDDYGNAHSQSIDQYSIPQLEQQAMEAQSANIQGVSGASYTSAGFKQSLQGALQQLGAA